MVTEVSVYAGCISWKPGCRYCDYSIQENTIGMLKAEGSKGLKPRRGSGNFGRERKEKEGKSKRRDEYIHPSRPYVSSSI